MFKRIKSVDLKFVVLILQKPSSIAYKNNIHTINDFFNKSVIKNVESLYGKPNLITSQNVLHIDDISNIFNLSYHFLKDGGFVFEVGYLKCFRNDLFDTIYHEHLDYHHAAPLVKFLNNIGFSIKEITELSQGGSIRFLLKSKIKTVSKQANMFVKNEYSSILYKEGHIKNWIPNIKVNLKK